MVAAHRPSPQPSPRRGEGETPARPWLALVAAFASLLALPSAALAQATSNATLPLLIGQGVGGTSYSVPIHVCAVDRDRSALPPKSPWYRIPNIAVATAGNPADSNVSQLFIALTHCGST